MRQKWSGNGNLVFGDDRVPVEYYLEARGPSKIAGTLQFTDGFDNRLSDNAGPMRLEMEGGAHCDIWFDHGDPTRGMKVIVEGPVHEA